MFVCTEDVSELAGAGLGHCPGERSDRRHGRGNGLEAALQRHLAEDLLTILDCSLIQEALGLARRRQQLTPQGYARRVQEIDNRLEDWLVDRFARFESLSPELSRLAKHIANHRDEWLLFLHEPAVPPTNNHAERMLRPAVITRKIGGCNKTLLEDGGPSFSTDTFSSFPRSLHPRPRHFASSST